MLEPLQLDRPLAAGSISLLQVDARIMPGWHINSDQPLNSDYIPTTLGITAPPAVTVGKLHYPPAELITPGFSSGEKLAVFTGKIHFTAELRPTAEFMPGGALPLTVTLDYQPCNDLQCLRPASVIADADLSAAVTSAEPVESAAGAAVSFDEAPTDASEWDVFRKRGYVLGFMLVLLGGLALNLTPCVYPLIGVTLAYFGNQGGGTRRVAMLAALYVLGIALMFSVVGMASALSGGLFGAALQNPIVLMAIASMLLILAASSFGWFQIQMPIRLLQLAGNAHPGYFGAVLMGLGMGVVAAPCIGPIVLGLLLVVERSQSVAFGFAVFFTLAVGLGLPYIALALAAGSIRKLPRSGEWLAWVEQFFGFVLIGMALYFLDPLVHGRIITRALPYYAAAVGIFLGIGSRAGNSWPAFRAFKRLVAATAAVALLLMLAPHTIATPMSFEPYDSVRLATAASEKRPVVIDFAADWCIPCREMENTTYVDATVVKAAARFVRLRGDLTQQGDEKSQVLVTKYGIQGVPTTVFIDSAGRVRKKIVGYIGPSEFVQNLHQVD